MTMIALRSLGMAVGAVSVLAIAACAPQQSATPAVAALASQLSLGASPSAAAPAQSATASGMQGHDMRGHDMQGHDMSSMDMQGMMAHCAQLRGQARQGGGAISSDTRRMLAQCDQMDRAHGMTPPRR